MERDKFSHLISLIDELSADKRYLLIVFMLRAQLVEYGIKHMFNMHPNTTGDLFLKRLTLGQAINKLEKIDDNYLSRIIEKAKEFNELRGNIMHRFLTSTENLSTIESSIKSQLDSAREIESEIMYLVDYIIDVYYDNN